MSTAELPDLAHVWFTKFCLLRPSTYVFFHRMSTKFFTENLKNLLTHPSTFGESGEGEVVRVDFTQT